MLDDGRPVFLQIADQIASTIADGSLAEEERAPSMNELATFYRINPATAAKGLNHLVDAGILYKKRGIGMFVATGARKELLANRQAAFVDSYISPLLAEAASLGLTPDAVIDLISKEAAR